MILGSLGGTSLARAFSSCRPFCRFFYRFFWGGALLFVLELTYFSGQRTKGCFASELVKIRVFTHTYHLLVLFDDVCPCVGLAVSRTAYEQLHGACHAQDEDEGFVQAIDSPGAGSDRLGEVGEVCLQGGFVQADDVFDLIDGERVVLASKFEGDGGLVFLKGLDFLSEEGSQIDEG